MKSTLDHLIHGHLDGSLTAAESAELNHLLKTDPTAADRFADLALLHHALDSGFTSGAFPVRNPLPAKKPSLHLLSFLKPIFPWGLAIAAAVVALLALKSPPTSEPEPIAAAPEKHNTGFAVLTRVVDPLWQGSAIPTQGDILGAGLLELGSGLVQIEFFSGVSLVVEGAAALEILSPNEMRLVRGKLRAHVPPPAIGFQIHTPEGTVVDLGTEFALDFTDKQSEVHVLDGEIEWHARTEPEVLLKRGSALRIANNETSAIPAEPTRFTGPGELAEKISLHQDARFTDWTAHSRNLRQQANILAYFPMEDLDSWSRELSAFPSTIAPGAIVGAKAVTGRWPSKHALDFSPNGSRVRLNIPGEHQAITFSTWAKIDSLDRQFNALFLTDNYGQGEPHWQLTAEGRLFLSIGIGPRKLHHIFLSPVVWDHTDSERWLHLVTTYDVATRICIHYLNGQEIFHEQAPADKGVDAITIGSAQIGNWGLPTREEPEFAVRNLNGRLDEFTLYQKVLPPQEIKNLYQAGKP